MLNYANLSDYEFEGLCLDIMSKKLNSPLRRFTMGKDGGIDLTDNVHTKNIVVQAKHYTNTDTNKLVRSLKNELNKVKKINPNQYFICCSKNLSPNRVNELYEHFSDFMESPNNIITLNEIDNFLKKPINSDVLKKHYKLWLDSTGILEDILNNELFVDCESLLYNIENERKIFVETEVFSLSKEILNSNKVLMLIGNPGIGKTITSKMLVLYYAAKGYEVRYSTNTENISQLKKSLSRDKNKKEIILLDDCFGQLYYKMRETQGNELLSLIKYINISPNKLLILNSRIAIFQEAKQRTPELVKSENKGDFRVEIIDVSNISEYDKGLLIYNHMYFNNVEKDYFNEIKKDNKYREIINHKNYNPRIIDYISDSYNYKKVSADKYYNYIIENLNNPQEVWNDEYENRIDKVDRIILNTLFSISESFVSIKTLRQAFDKRIIAEDNIDTTKDNFSLALKRLQLSFIKTFDKSGILMVIISNPSINDFLLEKLKSNKAERIKIAHTAIEISQIDRMLDPKERDKFFLNAISNGKINEFCWYDKDIKNSLIAYIISSNNIKDIDYKDIIHRAVIHPRNVDYYSGIIYFQTQLIESLMQDDIIDYYNYGNILNTQKNIESLIEEIYDLDDMIDILTRCYNHLNVDEAFIKISKEQIFYKIDELASDIDASDYNVDVGLYVDYDNEQDVDFVDEYGIEREVEDKFLSEIENQITLLPKALQFDENEINNLDCYVYGVCDLIYDYMNDNHKISKDKKILLYNYPDEKDEIDLLFNR